MPRQPKIIEARTKATKKPVARINGADTRRDKFVAEFLIDFNATQAAIRAGYSQKSAYSQGQRLLKDDDIASKLTKKFDKAAEKAEITAEETLRIIKQQATADARQISQHVIDSCRCCWGENNGYQRTVLEMQRDRDDYEFRKAKFEAKQAASEDPKDWEEEFDIKGGIGYDPRKAPNPDCMECFGRGVGRTLFCDTRNLSDDAKILFAGVKQTREGLEIKCHDQVVARGWMAKYVGLLTDRVDLRISGIDPELIGQAISSVCREFNIPDDVAVEMAGKVVDYVVARLSATKPAETA